MVMLTIDTQILVTGGYNVEGDRGAGARKNRGREGYGRREEKGREAGFPKWWEPGEKGKNFAVFRNFLR